MEQPSNEQRPVYRGPLTDTERWTGFVPRSGDTIVGTPPKSGTTWTITIVTMLNLGSTELSEEIARPWFEELGPSVASLMEKLDQQTHPRCIKTHAPFHALPQMPGVRFVAVYRHPIDTFLSFRKFLPKYKPTWTDHPYVKDMDTAFDAFLNMPFDRLSSGNTVSLNLLLNHYRANLIDDPAQRMLVLHYADMLRDPGKAVRQISEHLGHDHSDAFLDEVIAATRLDAMRKKSAAYAPRMVGDAVFRHDVFFDRGGVKKWEGILSKAQLEAYGAKIDRALTPSQRDWFENGNVSGP